MDEDGPCMKKRRGGQQQRLGAARSEKAHLEEAQAAKKPSCLADFLVERWSWGKYSPQEIQHIAMLATRDMEALGVTHVQPSLTSLASLGSKGKHGNNVHRDLMNVIKDTTQLPEPLLVSMPFKGKPGLLQMVMLPHLVFHCLFTYYPTFWKSSFLPTGVKGLVSFWTHFKTHPSMASFKGSVPCWQQWTLPLNLHGDAVPTVGCGKVWSKMLQAYSWTCLLSRGTTKQRSFFIWGATWLRAKHFVCFVSNLFGPNVPKQL